MRIDVAYSQLAFHGIEWLGAPSEGEHAVLERELGLLTGVHTGTVDVELRRYDSPPDLDALRAELADWDDVVLIAAMLDDDARIRSLMSHDPPGLELGLDEGLHAVLLARHGVDAWHDVTGDSDERILVITWPTASAISGATLQLRSSKARAAAAGPPAPPLPPARQPPILPLRRTAPRPIPGAIGRRLRGAHGKD